MADYARCCWMSNTHHTCTNVMYLSTIMYELQDAQMNKHIQLFAYSPPPPLHTHTYTEHYEMHIFYSLPVVSHCLWAQSRTRLNPFGDRMTGTVASSVHAHTHAHTCPVPTTLWSSMILSKSTSYLEKKKKDRKININRLTCQFYSSDQNIKYCMFLGINTVLFSNVQKLAESLRKTKQ